MLSFLENFISAIYTFLETLVASGFYPSALHSELRDNYLNTLEKVCDHLFSASSNTPEKANQV